MTTRQICFASLIAAGLTLWGLAVRQDARAQQPPEAPPAKAAAEPAPRADSNGLIRLSKTDEVWVDPKRKLVVVNGQVCLREGQLEMFACPKGSKEHESVISVNSKAQFVHAGLLAVGARVGNPVQFDPEYKPAAGSVIDVLVLWKDKEGNKHKDRGQDWIKNVKTGKAMEHPWVFAGSGFWVDKQSGEKFYHGDGGDFICVSNFPTATLDLPVKSSQANADLLFTAFTEHIPPLGTSIRLVLIPRRDAKDATKTSAPSPTAPEKPAGESGG